MAGPGLPKHFSLREDSDCDRSRYIPQTVPWQRLDCWNCGNKRSTDCSWHAPQTLCPRAYRGQSLREDLSARGSKASAAVSQHRSRPHSRDHPRWRHLNGGQASPEHPPSCQGNKTNMKNKNGGTGEDGEKWGKGRKGRTGKKLEALSSLGSDFIMG